MQIETVARAKTNELMQKYHANASRVYSPRTGGSVSPRQLKFEGMLPNQDISGVQHSNLIA